MAINVDIDLMVEESPEVRMSVDNIDEVRFGVDPSILVGDHDKLINRDAKDQHPISAITGLEEALDQSGRISTIQRNGVDLPIVNKTVNIQVPIESVNGKTGAVSLNASDVGALPDSTVIPDDSNLVHKTGEETITGKKTFTNSAEISRSNSGPILRLSSSAADTNFILERTGGSQCVLESGSAVGLFGTKTNHPLQIRTNYTNRMTIGTDGSVVLATDVASGSNSNQVATTKWVNAKGYATTSQIPTKTSDLTNDSGYITESSIPTEVLLVTVTPTSISGQRFFGTSDKSAAEIAAAVVAGKVPVMKVPLDANTIGYADFFGILADDDEISAHFRYEDQTSIRFSYVTLRVSGNLVVGDLLPSIYDVCDTLESNLSGHISDTEVHTNASEKASWNGKYTKPANGIPASDLAPGVIPTVPTVISDLQNDMVYNLGTLSPSGDTMGYIQLTQDQVDAIEDMWEKGFCAITFSAYNHDFWAIKLGVIPFMDADFYGFTGTFGYIDGGTARYGTILLGVTSSGYGIVARLFDESADALEQASYAFNAAQQASQEIGDHESNSSIHVSSSDRTNWNGKYTKPANGIPASDLAAGVIPTVPTNVSAFTNDAGYLVASDLTEATDANVIAIVV